MAGAKAAACPVCRAQSVAEHAPFCSPGCQDRDLLQWLGEGYKVPGPPVSPEQLADHLVGQTGTDTER